jgi:hypothetical protein
MQRIALFMMVAMLFFSSCSDKLYSHNEVVSTFRTPAELIARMGQPSEIKIVGKQKEYCYYYMLNNGKISKKKLDIDDPLSKHKPKATMDSLGEAIHYVDAENNPQSFNKNELNRFEYWIKYTYSEEGKLIKSEKKSVDLSVRVYRPGKTVIIVTLSSILIGLAIALPSTAQTGTYVGRWW